MATKQTNKPTDKKPAVVTKQVPATPKKGGRVVPPPAKPATKAVKLKDGIVKLSAKESKAFHSTKSMEEKTRIVAKAAIKDVKMSPASKKAVVESVVVKAKLAADTAVAKANLAKAQIKQVQANVNLKKADAKLKASLPAAPTKVKVIGVKSTKTIRMTEGETKAFKAAPTVAKKGNVVAAVVNRVGLLNKLKTDQKSSAGKPSKPVVAGPIRGVAADKQPKKVEPAKKPAPVKAAAKKTVKPAPAKGAVAKSTTSAPDSSRAGFSKSPELKKIADDTVDAGAIVQQAYARANPERTNPFVPTGKPNPFLPQSTAPAAPAAKIVNIPEMSQKQAEDRQAMLRKTFQTLTATARVGS